jgi:DNA repair protein RadC
MSDPGAKAFIVRELEVRYKSRKVELPEAWNRKIDSSRDIEAIAKAIGACEQPHESMWVIALNAKNKVIGYSEVARGGVVSVAVGPADIFRFLLICGASGFVLVHNHPSGDPHPSIDDIAFTDRVSRASGVVGIRILDHVIVGTQGAYSFVDARMLEPT